jgi:hypothetical protein
VSGLEECQYTARPCAPLSLKLDFVVAISRSRVSFFSYIEALASADAMGTRNDGSMNHADYRQTRA